MEEGMKKNTVVADAQASAPPNDLLGTLLSNPELIARVGAVLGAMNGRAENSESQSEASPKNEASTFAPAGDGIATLLQNPAILEKLPQMLAVMKPLMDNHVSKPQAEAGAVNAPPSHSNQREHLLLSLKPFLSKERCDAVDAILRISQLGDVLGKLK